MASKKDRASIAKAIRKGRVSVRPGLKASIGRMATRRPLVAEDFDVTEASLEVFRPNKRCKGGFVISWDTKSAGGGETTFWIGLDGKLNCHAECMSRSFIMNAFAKLLEGAEMDELTKETEKERKGRRVPLKQHEFPGETE